MISLFYKKKILHETDISYYLYNFYILTISITMTNHDRKKRSFKLLKITH